MHPLGSETIALSRALGRTALNVGVRERVRYAVDVRTNATITATEASQTAVRPDARFVLKLVRSMKTSRS